MQYSSKKLVTAITFSGFLIAMSIILQRLFVIPFGVPSLYRISLGNVPIIMGSLFLGPVFGGLVGAASDLIGIALFPVGTFVIWPTLTAAAYGIFPWLFLRLIFVINKRVKFPLLYPFLVFIFTTLFVYVLVEDEVRNPISSTRPPIVFTPTFKIIFSLVLLLLIGVVLFLGFYLDKKYKDKSALKLTGAPTQLALAILFTSFFTDVIYTSWWKLEVYHTNYMVSVFFHTAIMFILFPIQTSIIALLGRVYEKSNVSRLLNHKSVENDENDESHAISN